MSPRSAARCHRVASHDQHGRGEAWIESFEIADIGRVFPFRLTASPGAGRLWPPKTEPDSGEL